MQTRLDYGVKSFAQLVRYIILYYIILFPRNGFGHKTRASLSGQPVGENSENFTTFHGREKRLYLSRDVRLSHTDSQTFFISSLCFGSATPDARTFKFSRDFSAQRVGVFRSPFRRTKKLCKFNVRRWVFGAVDVCEINILSKAKSNENFVTFSRYARHPTERKMRPRRIIKFKFSTKRPRRQILHS